MWRVRDAGVVVLVPTVLLCLAVWLLTKALLWAVGL